MGTACRAIRASCIRFINSLNPLYNSTPSDYAMNFLNSKAGTSSKSINDFQESYLSQPDSLYHSQDNHPLTGDGNDHSMLDDSFSGIQWSFPNGRRWIIKGNWWHMEYMLGCTEVCFLTSRMRSFRWLNILVSRYWIDGPVSLMTQSSR